MKKTPAFFVATDDAPTLHELAKQMGTTYNQIWKLQQSAIKHFIAECERRNINPRDILPL